ncbi:MAG: Z1 domain-containing protein [Bacteroidales bacterium]|nr:Z1 domain-containing protein [Bacteroidales bacterium]
MIPQALRTIRTLLPVIGSLSERQIEDAVDIALSIPQYADIDRDVLIREVQSTYNIHIDDFRVIESSERRRPWVSDKKSTICWDFWRRYRDYLSIEKNFSDKVVNQLDRLTDRTLDGLFDPAISATIDKKGLVVGQVQSGKTANYTGLICKAADAGFKLIIVLAGIHNNLRSQTQLRLDEGFLGFNTKYAQIFNQIDKDDIWIGVGRISKKEIAHSITSCLDSGDFSQGAFNSLGLNFNTNEPIIAVVKKNARVLERLLHWLNAQAVTIGERRLIKHKSLLLIDDEADNASINTRPENDGTTRINGLIREIIRLFDKSGYVGYTATPFANIFIPIAEDELFPRDFIINIPAPSNYIGPDKIFGFRLIEDDEKSDKVLPVVTKIDDFHSFYPGDRRGRGVLPTSAPMSLQLAIKCFIITCAVRRLRRQDNVHNSMLVHVSRLVNWQRHIKDIVQNVFDFYRRGIELNIPSVYEEIRQAYEEDCNSYKSYKTTSQLILDSSLSKIDPHIQIHDWNEVVPFLFEAATRIQVREINGGSGDVLNYFDHKNGLSVIAIGGDKLSRGLTLEGLSVSYYLRASRMYDTLMQMGRWFGYRPGYVDLCRLFTSRELNEWFSHIALASEELRDEFDYMSDNAHSTPEQYALKVRTHPGVLQISASNKIRRAENIRVSWSGRLVETYELSKNPEVIQRNLDSAVGLVNSLGNGFKSDQSNYLWQGISFEHIKQFLGGFEVYDNLRSASPQNLIKFIDFKYHGNELQTWNVGVITKRNGTNFRINGEISVKLIVRTQDDKSNDELYYIRKSHIISPDDEFIDLIDEEREAAINASKRLWHEKGKEGEPNRINGEWVRNEIRKPNKVLLLLYFLDPTGAELPEKSNPLVGFAISFPGTERDDAVTYAVHSQLLQKFDIDDIYDSEDYDTDED